MRVVLAQVLRQMTHPDETEVVSHGAKSDSIKAREALESAEREGSPRSLLCVDESVNGDSRTTRRFVKAKAGH